MKLLLLACARADAFGAIYRDAATDKIVLHGFAVNDHPDFSSLRLAPDVERFDVLYSISLNGHDPYDTYLLFETLLLFRDAALIRNVIRARYA